MSTSALLRVFPDRLQTIEVYRNGHGTGAVLWTALADRYARGRSWITAQDLGWLWGMTTRQEIPEGLRLALAFTFDRAIVRHEDREALAAGCEEASKLIPPASANHWATLARDLRAAEPVEGQLGYGLEVTSVGSAWDCFGTREDEEEDEEDRVAGDPFPAPWNLRDALAPAPEEPKGDPR